MAVNWKLLSQSVLAGAAAAIYTPAAGKQDAVHTANAWNPTAAPITLNIYLVPAGGAAGDTTRVSQVSVLAGKTMVISDIINLKVVAPAVLFADGVGLTLTLTGAEADAS